MIVQLQVPDPTQRLQRWVCVCVCGWQNLPSGKARTVVFGIGYVSVPAHASVSVYVVFL